MKKKNIIIIVIIGLLSLFSYLSYNVITISKEKNKVSKKIQTIPKFELKTLTNIPFTNSNLKPNISTIFIYFSSECNLCHYEAESISQNLNKLKNIQLVFVSKESIDTIKEFSEEYKLNNQTNITFLFDSDFNFTTQFGAQSVPYILIYNKNKELVKKQYGQLNANGILRILKKND